jgi:ankyrin repeat protein
MQKPWRKSAVLLVIAATLVVLGGCATNGSKSESNKPINLMTPAELFGDPGLRALAEAAQNGDVRKIDALIAKGVNVNGTGKYGITPLFSAAQVQNKKGFKALLEHGANPNVVGSDGYTTLNFIARLSDPDFLKLALKHGANPNLVEPATGKTPIFLAVSPYAQGNLPILINAGANLNYKIPSTGWTPMMQAVIFGQFDTVYKLLKAGADYKIKDNSGWDLENYIDARATAGPGKKWRDKVIEYLKQHHAWHDAGSVGQTIRRRGP